VRLNDVAPDGAATRVTYGLLSLTHRDSHESPEPLVPGRRYRVRVPLKHIGQRFAVGHRLRLALSTSYWPIAWAPPEPVTLTVHTGASRLRLPVRAAASADADLPAFAEVMGARPLARDEIEAPESAWRVTHDLAEDEHALEIRTGLGTVRFPGTRLTVTTRGLERYSVTGDACGSQRGEARWSIAFSRDGWRVETVTHTVLTCSADAFHVTAELEAFENGALAHKQAWQRDIRRNLI
ncbi:MAG TPA: CocE/NonD family hydrolase C-terminal non-catalytic domain-containing protein, partial [Lichenihabitans sp.]|nr:CocE/NonD family hydrolase C-terminal non-catalytic domain-containing protein [Lichenihabitans sp.]